MDELGTKGLVVTLHSLFKKSLVSKRFFLIKKEILQLNALLVSDLYTFPLIFYILSDSPQSTISLTCVCEFSMKETREKKLTEQGLVKMEFAALS